MKARPILFSAEMIRAQLAGRKTQTRRIVQFREPKRRTLFDWKVDGRNVGPCRYGQPGDLLWVREAHAIVGNVDPGWVLYRASGYENECRRYRFDNPPPESEITWKPSIHMPRWASRLTLRITNIHVERLQDISDADAIAEGIEHNDALDPVGPCKWRVYTQPHTGTDSLVYSYQTLWESINGAESWAENPWVWAISFEVIKANVDNVLKREAA